MATFTLADSTTVSGGGSVWLYGATAPSGGLGDDGNYYIDTVGGAIYFKDSGSWSQLITLLSSLNGLVNPIQTFDEGVFGTDFNIASAAGVHTFNFPSASATNRGLITPSDYVAFSATGFTPSGLVTEYITGTGTYVTFPTNLSSFTNGPGFITASALSPYLLSSVAATTYFTIPVGSTSQYVRGDGTLATFPTIPSVTPSALTRVDDTNVTITLGGTPTTALLQAVSLTVGWSGTLADSRIASASVWNAKQNAITTGTTAQYFRGDLSLATFPIALLEFVNTSVKNANYTAVSGDRVLCNSSLGTFTITLPASGKVSICDVLGNSPTTGFGVNAVSVVPPSGTIMGGTSFLLDVGAITVDLEFIGTEWRDRNGR